MSSSWSAMGLPSRVCVSPLIQRSHDTRGTSKLRNRCPPHEWQCSRSCSFPGENTVVAPPHSLQVIKASVKNRNALDGGRLCFAPREKGSCADISPGSNSVELGGIGGLLLRPGAACPITIGCRVLPTSGFGASGSPHVPKGVRRVCFCFCRTGSGAGRPGRLPVHPLAVLRNLQAPRDGWAPSLAFPL